MRSEEVPQDVAKTYGGQRKLLYAVSSDGEYEGVASAGWEVETYATLAAVAELDALRDDAFARAQAGATSPLEYYMYRLRMEPATLSAASGVWAWRVKRHFKPRVFAGLSARLLQRYADVLGMSVEELKTLPAAPDA